MDSQVVSAFSILSPERLEYTLPTLRKIAYRFIKINEKINLVSPETIDDFEERHLLHCLSLTIKRIPPNASVVDWGTGGGLPALPLAASFPIVHFHAIDSVGKKIQAVRTIGRAVHLANLEAHQMRAEELEMDLNYSVSRATAPLKTLWDWHSRLAKPYEHPLPEDAWAPGLICLKGGDLTEEIAELKAAYPDLNVETIELLPILKRAYFAEKYIVHVTDPNLG
ncbi:MAG: class I SAM-dependent methyltransferase [Rhodothermales bacterium]